MYNRRGIDTYRQTNAHTMSREKLVVMLYEKMVSDIDSARTAAVASDRLGMTKHLSHSQMIVSDLRSALDHSIGGKITRNLETLYDYVFHEHLQMLVDLDPLHADNCLQVIAPLLDSWRKIPVGTGDTAAQQHAQGRLKLGQGADPATQNEQSASGPQNNNRLEADKRGSRPVGPQAATPSSPELTPISV